MFDFGEAIKTLKKSGTVSRKGWNGGGQTLNIQNPEEESDMNKSYIFIKASNGDVIPWVASQSDLLAEDWFIV